MFVNTIIYLRLPFGFRYGEFQHYTSLDFLPSDKCDITFEKPTFLMKLDAGTDENISDMEILLVSEYFLYS